MRIYTKSGDLAFKTFTFPDGQPHFKLETYEREFQCVTIETAIKSPNDLFTLGLVVDVLRNHGYSEVNLDIRYLMGARMDRAISSMEPYTLLSVARIINSFGLSRVRLLDVHSDVATKLIRNSTNLFPQIAVNHAVSACMTPNDLFACPDKGAWRRTMLLTESMPWFSMITCEKTRDMSTGALSGFKVNDASRVVGRGVLIIDDICDGGSTFIGLARVLREKGATKVNLFVTHGVFSKGLPLDGIDHVYTTDSYCKCASNWDATHRGQEVADVATIIPIFMKEL